MVVIPTTKMAENMDADEGPIRHLLPLESIKMMGESIGIGNLNDDAAVKLSEDLEYRLREMVQDATKFMRHSKRKKLFSADIDHSLKLRNVEPLYGFDTSEYIPFRHTSGGGKDLYYPDEKELNLMDLVNAPLPRLPCDITLRAHWLCVEGVQPVIPENPPPVTVEEQQLEATGSTLPLAERGEPISKLKMMKFERRDKKREENMSTEWSKLKPLQAHALSQEQQLYYREITDACIRVGAETKWQEALNSLSTDPGLYQLLPQFTSFINEGIRINIGLKKLAVLKHLVKMIGAILENESLFLEKYLHELIPSLTSCLINNQVCVRPESEDHWSLRDNAGKILAKICKRYSNSVNNIQSRLTRVLSQVLGSQGSLAVHYGAICGLVELGQDTIASLVIPRLKSESTLIQSALRQQSKMAEHVAANRLQTLILRHCTLILSSTRPASDTIVQYQNDYGSLGQALFNQIRSLRQNRSTGLQSTVTARVTTGATVAAAAKSPTVTFLKNKPPPLSLSSSQVMALRTNATSKLQQSPVMAAALQFVSQSAKSNPSTPTSLATPTSASISANILNAVMNSSNAQAMLAEHLTAALSGSAGVTISSPASSSPKTVCLSTPLSIPLSTPVAPQVPKSENSEASPSPKS